MSANQSFYDSIVLNRYLWVIAVFVAIMVSLSPFASNFRLDASSDSLVLENDESLKYFRKVVSKYASADLLVLTYAPKQDLFSDETLQDISELKAKLAKLEHVDAILSIVDVPLTQSPPLTIGELASSPRDLLDTRTNRELAKKEFTESQLYSDLLVSDDLSTTAIAISLKANEQLSVLLDQRNALREKRAEQTLSNEESEQLAQVSLEYQTQLDAFQASQASMIEQLREIITEHQQNARLFLGGLPMIVADSVSFINSDVVVFGSAAIVVIILILVIAFRQLSWVVVPLANCASTGFIIVCLLGLLNWPISVVSSNFLSLLLIITLSLNIHLIVRYRELAKQQPAAKQFDLLSETIRSKFIPCLYTALTTMVAFASLLVSGIRPVIDFGWIMCLGILVAFVTTFGLLPALAMLMKPRTVKQNRDAISSWILSLAQSLHQRGALVGLAFVLFTAIAALGLTRLTVENRFIDYFKPETEIYQGMVEIDAKLGGTTPLDIIIDAPESFLTSATTLASDEAAQTVAVASNEASETNADDDFDDGFDDFDDFSEEESTGLVDTSYWYNEAGVKRIQAIHTALDDIPATGKVMSLATTMSVFEGLKDIVELDNINLAFIENVLSAELRETLFKPYISADGNQLHFSIRVFETYQGLDRNQLIDDIRTMLISDHDLQAEQVNVSGMLVLYNNMLNSLFSSQILTLGTVFVVIFLMFIVLFRSFSLAMITIVPNVFSALLVLGVMGLFNIPLDLMTITIAAISVGIAVDNSIHFVSRFRDEMRSGSMIAEAINQATRNVGQAMFYTTIVITAGFLIMVFSNFVPTMYFGLLTGLAMVTALIANLLMLPILIAWIKPQVA